MPTFSEKPPFSRGLPEDWDPRLPWPADKISAELESLKLGIYITTHWVKVFGEERSPFSVEDPNYFSRDQYEHLYDAGLFPFRVGLDVEIDGGSVADVFYDGVLWEKTDAAVNDPEIRGHFAPMTLDALKLLRKQEHRSKSRVGKIDAAISLLEKAVAANQKAGYKPS